MGRPHFSCRRQAQKLLGRHQENHTIYTQKPIYKNIYHSLFLSHLTYGISAWGGVPKYKLNKIFAIQKRCIRLLFGNQLSYDHSEYYETCARARTYEEHCELKDYTLEHTKPLFKRQELLTVHNLYFKHVFMETFKVLKNRSPFGLFSRYDIREGRNKTGLACPKLKLKVSEQNFVYKSITLWNSLVGKILENNKPNSSKGYIVPGETPNSDLSASLPFIKKQITFVLLNSQANGCDQVWNELNFTIFAYSK